MNKAEDRAREYLKKSYPDAYIKKIPDFKQLGGGQMRGLPDYLVINHGEHYWFEIKYTTNINVFNFNDITEYQWIEFNKLLSAGADVWFLIYNKNNKITLTTFLSILELKKQGKNSMSINDI